MIPFLAANDSHVSPVCACANWAQRGAIPGCVGERAPNDNLSVAVGVGVGSGELVLVGTASTVDMILDITVDMIVDVYSGVRALVGMELVVEVGVAVVEEFLFPNAVVAFEATQ